MKTKQTLNLRQAANNRYSTPLATLHRCSPSKKFAQSNGETISKKSVVAPDISNFHFLTF